jgi:hypothetical protein
MKDLINEYYSLAEIKNIALENNIPEEYYQEFIERVNIEIEEMLSEESFYKEEIKESCIRFGVRYVDKYMEEIKKGHSKKWANIYANSLEEHNHAFNDAYTELYKIDTFFAKQEMKTHCKAVNGDEHFERYFLYLMNEGEGANNPDNQASIYSRTYKEQMANGKSERFAHEYANLMAEDKWTEAGCYSYAKAIDEGLSGLCAHEISEYYGNRYSHSSRFEYDDADLYFEAEILKKYSQPKIKK